MILESLTLILHFSLFILQFSMRHFQNGGHRLAIGGCAADAVLPHVNRPLAFPPHEYKKAASTKPAAFPLHM
jgi:hypothetical protein